MTFLEALRKTTESIRDWVNNKTADDFGIYVQGTEPVNAVDGDIWIDTTGDASGSTFPTSSSLPEVSAVDNGKVLMVVDGAWQIVDLNLSADDNGVLSI